MSESEAVVIQDHDIDIIKKNADKAASLLKALANKQRLMILCNLARGEMSVSTLNELLDLSQSALSQHLARLRQDELVVTRREAQTIYYSLKQGLASQVIELFYHHYCDVDGV
jgi:DNA-binding transcriptional ArsR family regulator